MAENEHVRVWREPCQFLTGKSKKERGVMCSKSEMAGGACKTCGWNPKVAEERTARYNSGDGVVERVVTVDYGIVSAVSMEEYKAKKMARPVSTVCKTLLVCKED